MNKLINLFRFLLLFFLSTSLFAQRLEPENNVAQVVTTSAGEPESTDTLFVNGTGDDFDKLLRREEVPKGRATYKVIIDRYYSHQMAFNEKGFLIDHNDLIRDGLIPKTALLKLRVYDVDNEGKADFMPEVDHIYVNGNLVKYKSGEPFKLTSGNRNWSINSIEIPIEYLKFPKTKGTETAKPAAENIIEIDIDLYEQRWQVKCDWISIEIESPIRPVLMIHGFGGSDETWTSFKNFFKNDGIPYYNPPSGFMDKYGSVSSNAFDINQEVKRVKMMFGVNKVNLIAHSKGGLDSRNYLRVYGRNDVERLIQLATPNNGSEKADLLYAPAVVSQFTLPAAIQLTTEWIRNNFNYFAKNENGEITYKKRYTTNESDQPFIYILAGTKENNNDWNLVPPHDNNVSIRSATLPWNNENAGILTENQIYPNLGRINNGELPYEHSEMHEKAIVYFEVKKILKYPVTKNKRNNINHSAPVALEKEVHTDSLQSILNVTNSIVANSQKIEFVHIDSTRFVKFIAANYGGGFSFYLINPLNEIIDSSSSVFSSSFDETGRVVEYKISEPLAGTWQLITKTYSKPVVVLNKVSLISETRISLLLEKINYNLEKPFLIGAELLKNGVSLSGAEVTATIYKYNGTSDSLLLYDDGTHSDKIANDGKYFNIHSGVSIKGTAQIKVKSKRDNEIRTNSKQIYIIPNSAKLDGTYNEIEIDSDGDGLIDSLKIKVGVNIITPGHFSLSASLKNSSDSTITTATFISISGTELSSGTQNIDLTFIGKEIFKQGFDGPYLLSDVSLSDLSSNLEVDFATQPFTTQAYTKNRFERPAIFLTGNYSETTTSSNGKIEWLTISFDTDVIKPGRYKYNAQLTDTNNNVITWAKWETSVLESEIGTNTFYLFFKGKEINKKRFNGPYVVKNLSIYSEDISLLDVNVFEKNLLTTANYNFADFRGKLIVANLINSVTSSPIRNAEIAYFGTESNIATRVFAYGTTDKDGKMFFGGLNDGYYNFYAVKDTLNSDTIYASVYLDSAEVTIEMAIENSPPIFNNLPDSLSMLSNETQNISLWDFISDNESSDSSLYFDFKSSPEVFNYLFDKEVGVLNISLQDTTFGGSSILTIRADDTYGGVTEASIKINVTSLTSVEVFDNSIPQKFELYQNYPNPFNPATTIKYGLPFDAKVTLKIFDILGREVVTLIDKNKKAGTYRIKFNSKDISSGVYFYTISVHSVDGKFFTKTKKFILMK